MGRKAPFAELSMRLDQTNDLPCILSPNWQRTPSEEFNRNSSSSTHFQRFQSFIDVSTNSVNLGLSKMYRFETVKPNGDGRILISSDLVTAIKHWKEGIGRAVSKIFRVYDVINNPFRAFFPYSEL